MAAIRDIVFDCRHPASLARFWAEALDGYDVAPYDEAELERLAAAGLSGPEDDPTVLVEGRAGPRLWFQLVDEGKVVKNRVHLDLRSEDIAAEVERLVQLGATELHRVGSRVTMADPEGNEFCIDRS
ncbi:MAG TPA: VOC family protein [Acidimicrobiales bacterium]|nr:VOC family protein [Acidimicrobiales bacterium]